MFRIGCLVLGRGWLIGDWGLRWVRLAGLGVVGVGGGEWVRAHGGRREKRGLGWDVRSCREMGMWVLGVSGTLGRRRVGALAAE